MTTAAATQAGARFAIAPPKGGWTLDEKRAIVRGVYDFVVSQTRYVGLEFGIHGYKPYRVDQVLARRFGDCKDKASLVHALLGAAGIDSRLVLLRMRRLGRMPETPASLAVFNHAIAYVPDTETKIKIAADGKSIDEAAVKWIVSPYDEFALEEAIKTKEAKGAGTVTVVSVGPERAKTGLRECLARGADEAIWIDSGTSGFLDALATAKAIAAVAKERSARPLACGL